MFLLLETGEKDSDSDSVWAVCPNGVIELTDVFGIFSWEVGAWQEHINIIPPYARTWAIRVPEPEFKFTLGVWVEAIVERPKEARDLQTAVHRVWFQ